MWINPRAALNLLGAQWAMNFSSIKSLMAVASRLPLRSGLDQPDMPPPVAGLCVHNHCDTPHGQRRAVDGCWPKPGRRSKDRNVELEVEEVEIVAVTNLIKSQASKLTLVRGKSVWD